MKKEDIVFALYKDNIVMCNSFCELCRKKFNIEKPMEVYVRINNYQIDKYGRQLVYDSETSEDWEINNKRSNYRVNNRKAYYKGRRIKDEN